MQHGQHGFGDGLTYVPIKSNNCGMFSPDLAETLECWMHYHNDINVLKFTIFILNIETRSNQTIEHNQACACVVHCVPEEVLKAQLFACRFQSFQGDPLFTLALQVTPVDKNY